MQIDRPTPTAAPVLRGTQADRLKEIINQDRQAIQAIEPSESVELVNEVLDYSVSHETVEEVNDDPIIKDNPDTKIIETSWRFTNPKVQDGIMCITSVSDGVKHKFKVYDNDNFIQSVKTTLSLVYDVSNLKL